MISPTLQNFTGLFGVTPMSHKVRSKKVRNTNFISTFGAPKKRPLTERDLLRMESAIGAGLFGAVTPSHQREFFCLDARTWVWFETWTDERKVKHEQTTRYEIHSNGIVKVQPDKPYVVLKDDELVNFQNAMRAYYEKVTAQLYSDIPSLDSVKPSTAEISASQPVNYPDNDTQLAEIKNREYIQNIYNDSRREKTDQTTANTLQ